MIGVIHKIKIKGGEKNTELYRFIIPAAALISGAQSGTNP